MPRVNTKKIKSAPSRLIFLIALLGLLLFSNTFAPPKERSIYIGSQKILLEVVETQAEREKGLSGRKALTANSGMLFVFEQQGKHCFWMKDMNFPLDIIWLNSEKQIIHIVPNVKPATYPNDFCPDAPAKYVLELNAGQAQALDLLVGSRLSF